MKSIANHIRTGLCILCLCSSWQVAAQSRVQLQKGLSILLPIGFVAVPEAEIAEQYAQATLPLAIYTHHEAKRTQWVFTLQPSRWAPKDIALMQAFMRANAEALYEGEVQWLQARTTATNGQPAVYLAFTGTRSPEAHSIYGHRAEKDFHALLHILWGTQQLTLHFSCPASDYPRWEKEIEAAIATLRLP